MATTKTLQAVGAHAMRSYRYLVGGGGLTADATCKDIRERDSDIAEVAPRCGEELNSLAAGESFSARWGIEPS